MPHLATNCTLSATNGGVFWPWASHWWCWAQSVLRYRFAATLTSVVVFGFLLVAAGITQVVSSFWSGKWSGMLLHLLIGVLYTVVGFMMLDAPVENTLLLTKLIAVFMIVTGIFNVVASLAHRFHGWGWVLLNGCVTMLLGMLINKQWPSSALWVIGLFVGIEMIFNGWGWIMLSLGLRSSTSAASEVQPTLAKAQLTQRRFAHQPAEHRDLAGMHQLVLRAPFDRTQLGLERWVGLLDRRIEFGVVHERQLREHLVCTASNTRWISSSGRLLLGARHGCGTKLERFDEAVGNQRFIVGRPAADPPQAQVVLGHRQMTDLPRDVRGVLRRRPEPFLGREVWQELAGKYSRSAQAFDRRFQSSWRGIDIASVLKTAFALAVPQ